LFSFIGIILYLVLGMPEVAVFLLVQGMLFAVYGVLTSRSNSIALYIGILHIGGLALMNLVFFSLFPLLMSILFLYQTTSGIKPMQRILAKGHKVTRAF
jgi:hypothetical protein